MEEKIRSLYTKLSNKVLENNMSPIVKEAFTSVLLDRFVAELRKLNIDWDLTATSIEKLTKGDSLKNVSSSVDENYNNSKKLEPKNEFESYGIGIDIQRIDVFPIVEDYWEDIFYNENFTKNEIGYSLKKENPVETLAGIFAAKEAIFKATGRPRKNIEIIIDVNGKPNALNSAISISHDGNYALATAVKINVQNIETTVKPPSDKIKEELQPDPQVKKSKGMAVIWILVLLIIFYLIIKEIGGIENLL